MCEIETTSDRFQEILEQMLTVHRSKANDYGHANLLAAEAFGIPAWVGVMIRANDKMQRIMNYAKNGSLENEPPLDSMLDLANYAVLAYELLEKLNAPQS